ncbi:hypothetical protein [Aquipuribacter hungaricus]|uniref:Tryptophan-rich sensory protein n=1 Tax=Aquipuribacter hungaricus TaxID=545624 RepID=A0ABV7WFH8_9MICO
MTAPDPTSAPTAPGDARRGDGGTGGRADHGTADVVRAVAVVVAAVAQVVCSPLGAALPGARSVADVSDAYTTVITPAGYAFAIWGLIFLGCLAWAVYQALPSQLGRSVHRRAGWPLAVAFAANAAWETVFPRDGTWVLVAQGLIVVAVAASATALGRLQDPEPQGLARLLPSAVAALLLGWVTIATVANVGITGVYLGAPAQGGLAEGAGIVALLAAAAVVLDVTLRLRTSAGPFALAAGWGLLAVARHDPPFAVGIAAWVAVAVVVAGLGVQVWRTRRPVRVLVG